MSALRGEGHAKNLSIIAISAPNILLNLILLGLAEFTQSDFELKGSVKQANFALSALNVPKM